jgi:hypothetical protein
VERTLSIVSALLIAGSFAAALHGLGQLAAANDLRGLLFCGVALAAGVTATRMLGGAAEGE